MLSILFFKQQMAKFFLYLRRLLLIILPVLVAVYGVWYVTSTHGYLADWYKNVNPHFYQSGSWADLFFTTAVKQQGNWWCLLASLASGIGAFLCWKTPFPAVRKIVLKKQEAAVYLVIAIVGAGISLKANFHTAYSSDEVFSYLNFASLPFFQTISFYALPNNHPLFNCLSGWGSDPVLSGRIISMCCYIGVLFFTWYFLKKWKMGLWLRVAALLVVALQFSVWGFSTQARGYEMVLFFSCLSFGAFYNYFIENKKQWLLIHAACNITGFLTVPTFLYWWAGLLLASVFFQISNRRLDWAFMRLTVIGFAFSLVAYLPLLTFSGLRSITQNKYVQSADTTTFYFITHLNEQKFFNVLFREWFCTLEVVLLIGIIGISLPVLLFFVNKKNTAQKKLGIIYFSILFAFLAMAILMLRFPFTRNLIAHGYLVSVVLLVTLSHLFGSKFLQIILTVLVVVYAGFIGHHNYKKIPYHLYYYGVAEYELSIGKFTPDMKSGSTVYLDDNCFYWWAVLKNKFPEKEIKMDYGRSRFNRQDYCIMPIDSLPPANKSDYELLEKGAGQFLFYKKK